MYILSDELGAFGSPFVDSIRTATTEETTQALHIFYLRPSIDEAQARQLLTSSGNMFTQVNGGDYTIAVLSANQLHTSL